MNINNLKQNNCINIWYGNTDILEKRKCAKKTKRNERHEFDRKIKLIKKICI